MAHQTKIVVEKTSSKGTKSRRGRGRRRSRGDGLLGADIAPSRIPPPRGNSITVTGEDRLFALDIKKGSAVFSNVDISPGVSQRLGTIARAYQRIRWNSVKVIVTPQASTITNGGYVCGFIMDPEDKTVTARDLSASQGSLTKKWYESAVVSMPRKPDLLYTSPGEEPRLSIPTSFWIVGEGPPSSDISVILTFIWNVTLLNPTMEDISNLSFTMTGEIRGNPGNYNLRWFRKPSSQGEDVVTDLMPAGVKALQGDHFFRVPTFIIEYKEGTGDTGSIQAHFIVYRVLDGKLYYSSNGRDIITNNWQGDVEANQVLIPCATYCKYIGPGNLCKAVRNPQPSLYTSGVPSEEHWSRLTKELLTALQLCKESRKPLETNSIPSSGSSMEKLDAQDS